MLDWHRSVHLRRMVYFRPVGISTVSPDMTWPVSYGNDDTHVFWDHPLSGTLFTYKQLIAPCTLLIEQNVVHLWAKRSHFLILFPIVMAIDKFGEDLHCSEGRIDCGKISLINFMSCSQFRVVICEIYCQPAIYRLKCEEKHISWRNTIWNWEITIWVFMIFTCKILK